MRQLLFIILLFFCCLAVKPSKSPPVTLTYQNTNSCNSGDSDMVFACEIPIAASVNWREWTSYLSENLVLDSLSLDTMQAGSFTAFISFTIDTIGKIGNVHILKDPGFGLGKRAVDVISNYHGRWQPCISGGKAVSSYRTQPVTFVIEEEEDNAACENMPANDIL